MPALETSPRGARAIVTGALGGLGRAIVEALASTGCRVGVADVVPTADAFGDEPAVVARASFDLRDREATRRGIESLVSTLGGCDALVANAGVVDTIHRAERFSEEEWKKDIETNLSGQFWAIQAAFPALVESSDPRIVVISSVAADSGLSGQVAYAASKAGLLGMVRTIAAEWARHGIRCNAILPGLIRTPKVAALPESLARRLNEGIALGRPGDPAELAGAVAFLLSPASAYITGTILRVDGGAGLSGMAMVR